MKIAESLEGGRKLCPLCGKEFWAHSDWAFRKRDKRNGDYKYYCSWGCIRKLERQEPSLRAQVDQAIRDGLTDKEIKTMLGCTQRFINDRRGVKE